MTINEKLPDGSTLRQTVAEVSMKINENAEKVENALRVLENATVDTSGVAAANQVIAGSAASYEEIAKLLEEMAADAPTSDTRAYIEHGFRRAGDERLALQAFRDGDRRHGHKRRGGFI